MDTLMRFGMDIYLTPEEEEIIAPIVKPCYAALGLANDYFSFDVEWEEFKEEESATTAMTNAVWLFMQWHQVDQQAAKRCVQEVTNKYEKEYRQRVQEFVSGQGKTNAKVQVYLSALGYQIPGNVSWSLRCPRYHPWLGGEARAILHDSTGEIQNAWKPRSISGKSDTSQSSVWSGASDSSPRSSISSAPSIDVTRLSDRADLGSEVRIYRVPSFLVEFTDNSTASSESRRVYQLPSLQRSPGGIHRCPERVARPAG